MDVYGAAICFNTVEAAKQNLPKPETWKDLTKPVYKGQIVMPNPASSGTGYLDVTGWLQMWGEADGWKYMDALHENIAQYTHSGSQAVPAGRRGRVPDRHLVRISRRTRSRKGAPIDIVFPNEGLGWDLEATGIMKTTKKLDAAKKLMDWLATPEAMELFAKNFAVVAMPGHGEAARLRPGRLREAAGQERLRVVGEEPRQDPRRVDQALRREVRAEEVAVPAPDAPRPRRGTRCLIDAEIAQRDATTPTSSSTASARASASFEALTGVALEVSRGELMVFLGPSGCGKTTLLRIIAGLETQDTGTIVQDGRDISRLPAIKRDYGIVFQSYALFPNLTIFDNVAYGLVNRRQGRGAIAARVAELLALVGLPDRGAKYPGQLSGGQQQRIALARALATSPGLLLLDEPLSALDALERVRLRGEIRALQQRLGVTTIMVTHDQEEALSMADRIVVMNHGRIEQVGTPREIYETPATPFVADFVGKVNVLPAVAEGGGRFRVGGLSLRGRARRTSAPARR